MNAYRLTRAGDLCCVFQSYAVSVERLFQHRFFVNDFMRTQHWLYCSYYSDDESRIPTAAYIRRRARPLLLWRPMRHARSSFWPSNPTCTPGKAPSCTRRRSKVYRCRPETRWWSASNRLLHAVQAATCSRTTAITIGISSCLSGGGSWRCAAGLQIGKGTQKTYWTCQIESENMQSQNDYYITCICQLRCWHICCKSIALGFLPRYSVSAVPYNSIETCP